LLAKELQLDIKLEGSYKLLHATIDNIMQLKSPCHFVGMCNMQ